MCNHGDTIDATVPIPAHLSHTGVLYWAVKPIDACIVDIVESLNDAGVYTSSSCCGHGKIPGSIILHDGREITISEANTLIPWRKRHEELEKEMEVEKQRYYDMQHTLDRSIEDLVSNVSGLRERLKRSRDETSMWKSKYNKLKEGNP